MSNKTCVYSEPVRAKYKHYHFDRVVRQATPMISDVEVIGKGSKRYKIKLLTSDVIGHSEGDIMWADTANIIFPKEDIEQGNRWYDNM